ncbi:hypothetical protein [Candidatus Electronema sp. JM]
MKNTGTAVFLRAEAGPLNHSPCKEPLYKVHFSGDGHSNKRQAGGIGS